MENTIDKQELIEWINDLDNQALLVTLQSMKNNATDGDFWDDISEETKQAISTAKAQLDEGKGISHDEVMRQIRERFL
ncbi:hypothetical protein [Fodinibius halophilus]|uniref:Addiction module protein n=1 Tax=Fodinibius halophilus TaxID=1736908 RepID=A0A6M1ST62_9BACT|nr:hypothetical protein [Fodinibius halophilus]NGP87118.1 hypothetical protein [Fodinibius halophilus]